jgi:RNase P subunit RPR2
MTFGKCPHCKKPISKPRLEAVEIANNGVNWKGVSYFCPSCNSVLSVSIDPLALKSEIIKELRNLLGR